MPPPAWLAQQSRWEHPTSYPTSRHSLRDRDNSAEVTYVELFFDLVFVFAFIQLSHYLLNNLTAEGVMRTLLLFVAVWWVWIYTSWVTNWLDPYRSPVRLLLFSLMLAGLIMSVALPEVFDEQGLAVADQCYGGVGHSFLGEPPSGPKVQEALDDISAWVGGLPGL